MRAYRDAIDERMDEFFESDPESGDALDRVELGLHHEQQHQELILTDIHHALWSNPLRPAYADNSFWNELSARSSIRSGTDDREQTKGAAWVKQAGGLVEIGFAGQAFSFDNERPRHRVYLEPFLLAAQPVSAGDYLR